tara:strand:- start:312 stop:566 length:255 start_codon:yes stop_codon:yes gene_type:complete
MKNTIKIWNPSTGESSVSLDFLRTKINERRKLALNNKKVTVHCKDVTNLQPSAHYASFEISRFSHKKAIEVYNNGGCQVASIIN